MGKALVYDERRGNSTVGAQVRDAACYVCWSLARAFAPAVLAPHLNRLVAQLVAMEVFDREVNCRRAASAAFQEIVGRQGAENVPYAIDILTLVDYHAVGSRTLCFTDLPVKLARFDPDLYGRVLVDHLIDKKVGHWDIAIRELAATSLKGLCAVMPQVLAKEKLPVLLETVLNTKDLCSRHGSLLAVGAVVCGLALHQLEQGSSLTSLIGEPVQKFRLNDWKKTLSRALL